MAARVLIIEGDRFVRLALHRLLDACGYDAREAGTSSAALKLLADEDFDAVVMDLDLSGLDGIELIAALKRRRPDLAIVATSGDGPKRLRSATAHGADAVLEKPYDAKDLIAVLRKLAGVSDTAG